MTTKYRIILVTVSSKIRSVVLGRKTFLRHLVSNIREMKLFGVSVRLASTAALSHTSFLRALPVVYSDRLCSLSCCSEASPLRG